MGLTITKYAPAAALQTVVDHYWAGIWTDADNVQNQKIFPSSYLEVVLPLGPPVKSAKKNNKQEAELMMGEVGFWTIPHALPRTQSKEWFGICFNPEALPGVFGVSASDVLNSAAPCQKELDASFSTFRQRLSQVKSSTERVRLTDTYLKSFIQAASPTAESNYVQTAARLIRLQKCHVSVEGLSQNLCIGMRQLERAFKKDLGLSPKTYMRLSRLSSVLQLIAQNPNLPLAQLSYLGGYSDQAHFNREFKRMTGVVPTKYLAHPQEFLTF
ncbi:helix-turn-helix domain-containing protein [Nibribacter koreensis]